MFEASAKRGADMVRQLLTFAKGAEGERVLIQPGHLIKELKKIMEGSFPKNIQLAVKCDPKLPNVLGDATQLHQILLNLCVNARDAMPHGGTLTLEAESLEVDAVYASSVHDAKPGKYLALRCATPARASRRKLSTGFSTRSSQPKAGQRHGPGPLHSHGHREGPRRIFTGPFATRTRLDVHRVSARRRCKGEDPGLPAEAAVKFRGRGKPSCSWMTNPASGRWRAWSCGG